MGFGLGEQEVVIGIADMPEQVCGRRFFVGGGAELQVSLSYRLSIWEAWEF